MADKTYIVEFSEAVERFENSMSDPNLPTVDLDMAKWCIMGAFEKPHHMQMLDQTAHDLAYRDWLIGNALVESKHPRVSRAQTQLLRANIYNILMELGQDLHQQMRSMGLIQTGLEQYKINNSLINNDTYLLEQIRVP